MDLATWLEETGESMNGLANKAGVAWRTVRDGAEGKLRSATKARQLAEHIGRDENGEFIVDPATMLNLGADDAAA